MIILRVDKNPCKHLFIIETVIKRKMYQNQNVHQNCQYAAVISCYVK